MGAHTIRTHEGHHHVTSATATQMREQLYQMGPTKNAAGAVDQPPKPPQLPPRDSHYGTHQDLPTVSTPKVGTRNRWRIVAECVRACLNCIDYDAMTSISWQNMKINIIIVRL